MKNEKSPASAVVAIRVIPRSPRSRVGGLRGEAVLIRLAAPPIEGAANDALVALLSNLLDLPRRNITIVSGDTSRNKRVRIEGIDEAEARARLLR